MNVSPLSEPLLCIVLKIYTYKVMKKTVKLFIAIILGFNSFAQTTWKVDPSHSKIGFSVTHLVISEVEGNFKTFDGTLVNKESDFSGAKISFSIDVSSIDTDIEQRDGHLKSEDFFFVEKHPKIAFTSTSFTKKGKDKYQLKGKLTMRGVTKDVVIDVKYGGEVFDGYGNTRIGFSGTTILNRLDYGIAWNSKTEHGTWTVGEDVNISLKLEFIKQ